MNASQLFENAEHELQCVSCGRIYRHEDEKDEEHPLRVGDGCPSDDCPSNEEGEQHD